MPPAQPAKPYSRAEIPAEQDDPLFWAALFKGDENALRERVTPILARALLDDSPSNLTPLLYSLLVQNFDAAGVLAPFSDPNAKTNQGHTALTLAIDANDTDLALHLLPRSDLSLITLDPPEPSDPDAIDEFGQSWISPVTSAIANGMWPVLDLLTQHLDDPKRLREIHAGMGSHLPKLEAAFAASADWLAAAVETGGFFFEKPFDHNLGWGVACLEMNSLGKIPEDKIEARHRLLSWLSRRHATETEMKQADSWGLPQDMQWNDRMILSVIWSGADGFRRHDTTDEQSAARSRESLQAFFDRGFIGADDIESSLKSMFRDNARSSLREAPGFCAYLAFDEALAEKAWRESRNMAAGLSWLDDAREMLREMEQEQRPRHFAARVVAAVEALELRVVVAESASAASVAALADPLSAQARVAPAKTPRL